MVLTNKSLNSWRKYENNEIRLLYGKYQEWKATNFMFHFCVPTFMIQKYSITSLKKVDHFKIN